MNFCFLAVCENKPRVLCMLNTLCYEFIHLFGCQKLHSAVYAYWACQLPLSSAPSLDFVEFMIFLLPSEFEFFCLLIIAFICIFHPVYYCSFSLCLLLSVLWIGSLDYTPPQYPHTFPNSRWHGQKYSSFDLVVFVSFPWKPKCSAKCYTFLFWIQALSTPKCPRKEHGGFVETEKLIFLKFPFFPVTPCTSGSHPVGHIPFRLNNPFTGDHIRYLAYHIFTLGIVTVAKLLL